MKTLKVIGWHIGNNKFLSPAIIEQLYDVEVIVSESAANPKDGSFWNNEEPPGPLASYMTDNQHKLLELQYDELLAAGEIDKIFDKYDNVALMVFEGMPGIQDPGAELIEIAHARDDVRVIPIPGPDAASTAISVSGFFGLGHLFGGYCHGRQEIFNKLELFKPLRGFPIVIYFRDIDYKDMVSSVIDVFGPQERMTVAVNLTRDDEIVLFGTAEELIDKKIFNHIDKDMERNKCAVVIENPGTADEIARRKGIHA